MKEGCRETKLCGAHKASAYPSSVPWCVSAKTGCFADKAPSAGTPSTPLSTFPATPRNPFAALTQGSGRRMLHQRRRLADISGDQLVSTLSGLFTVSGAKPSRCILHTSCVPYLVPVCPIMTLFTLCTLHTQNGRREMHRCS